MSKPDWKDAPEWAQWLAMDINGDWWWYEGQPGAGDFVWDAPGRMARAHDCEEDWKSSAEQRPCAE